MAKSEWELRILLGTNESVQKTVNQWKHEYNLKFHSVFNIDKDHIKIVLVRMPK